MAKRASATNKHWGSWLEFCAAHSMCPYDTSTDFVPCLQVFGRHIHDGRLTTSREPAQSGSVSDALQNVGQVHKWMGAPDIQLDSHGKFNFRLSRQLRWCTKQDAPPRRVKPVPVAVVSTILHHAHTSNETCNDMLAIANVTCIGFHFLCRPGEHLLSTDNTPFFPQDVTLHRGADMLTHESTGMVELDNATSVALTFITQTNGVKRRVIRNGMTGDPIPVPCKLQCATFSATNSATAHLTHLCAATAETRRQSLFWPRMSLLHFVLVSSWSSRNTM